MSKTQLKVLWVGIGILVLMGLFPPWIFPWILPANSPGGVYLAVGYHFILKPPKMNDIYTMRNLPDIWTKVTGTSSICRIDVPRLISQWIMVAIVTGGLLVTLKDKKKD